MKEFIITALFLIMTLGSMAYKVPPEEYKHPKDEQD
jgi:hypothetical protein